MIILPSKNMTLNNIPGNPFSLPYRPPSGPWPAAYINGIPTKFIANYARTVMGFYQTTRFGQSFTQTSIPYITATSFFLNKYLVYSPYATRSFSQVNYVIDPLSERIEYAELGSPINMQYCGTGGVNTVTGFIVQFMDPYTTQLVLWNSYSGGVTGGADTCAVNMRNSYTVGFNSKWNGYGSGPYESITDPFKFTTQNSVVQISDKMIAVNDSAYIYVYSFDNGIIDGGGCAFNIIKPKVSLIDKISIDQICGVGTYHITPSQMTSKMDGSFMFTAYAPGNRSFIGLISYPGPIVQIANVAYFGSSYDFTPFIDNDGYLILMNNPGNMLDNQQNSYVTSDTLQLNVSFSVPAKTPPPESINKTNTIRKFNIDRTF